MEKPDWWIQMHEGKVVRLTNSLRDKCDTCGLTQDTSGMNQMSTTGSVKPAKRKKTAWSADVMNATMKDRVASGCVTSVRERDFSVSMSWDKVLSFLDGFR